MFEAFPLNLLWLIFVATFETSIFLLLPILAFKCARKVSTNEFNENNVPINKDSKELVTDNLSQSENSKKETPNDLSGVRDSIKVAKLNQQRNSPTKDSGAPTKTTKMIFTKSVKPPTTTTTPEKSTAYESTGEASFKLISAESLTDEILVPIGKTANAPVPQSSLTSVTNLKIHGQPRSEISIRFGEERISTKRTKPLSEAV